ncbi:oxidoreductase-like domain-containing protein [Chitinimonas sp.]|uniref:oxidoreductase-like domain-containing protein n=1 Tax=Chitinimonas sp. TaxID=1934313 RepID=UPI0035B1AD2F
MNDIPPRPEPPIPPDDGLCCNSGCELCVWDYYNQELADYRRALAQWQAQYGEPPAPGSDQP